MLKLREFEIDLDRTGNYLVLGLKNTTNQVQNFSFAHHHLTLKPREIGVFRTDKVYLDIVTQQCKGRFIVKECTDLRSIVVKNISSQRMSCILEDTRPVLMVPGESIVVHKVKFLRYYKQQPGLETKIYVPEDLDDKPKSASVELKEEKDEVVIEPEETNAQEPDNKLEDDELFMEDEPEDEDFEDESEDDEVDESEDVVEDIVDEPVVEPEVEKKKKKKKTTAKKTVKKPKKKK